MSSSSLVLQPPSPSAHFINDEYANDVDSAMEIEKSEEVSTQNTLKDLTTIIFDWVLVRHQGPLEGLNTHSRQAGELFFLKADNVVDRRF